ncbi:MAG: methionyl-tRNA formyltransferase [Clostridia bacterium]|nr:methionyl-tRNA formyltransferase [Clostridia bacterium]
MKIVFMGTPEFAVPSLQALIDRGEEIVGVVTQPDRPVGRSGKLQMTPVKQLALAHNLPVIQFEKLRVRAGRECLESLGADLFVTAAFGQILSRRILALPPKGTINVHASLLPAYRGAAPIQWSLIQGETVTGVSTMFTDAGIDTGDILLQRQVPIDPADNSETLSSKLASTGAQLLCETLDEMEKGTLRSIPQDEDKASYFPMLTKEDGFLSFGCTAWELDCRIRGVTPWPGAYGIHNGMTIKIWKAHPVAGQGNPGEILVSSAKGGLIIACGQDALEIDEMQVPGGKRMTAKAYLMGRELKVGSRFEVKHE